MSESSLLETTAEAAVARLERRRRHRFVFLAFLAISAVALFLQPGSMASVE